MATWLLTPNAADPITGLRNSAIGWHLTAATALDVLEGMAVIGAVGYGHSLNSIDITVSPPIYQLVMNKGAQSVVVNDTDWFACDGRDAWAITEDDITNNYTVTTPGGS